MVVWGTTGTVVMTTGTVMSTTGTVVRTTGVVEDAVGGVARAGSYKIRTITNVTSSWIVAGPRKAAGSASRRSAISAAGRWWLARIMARRRSLPKR